MTAERTRRIMVVAGEASGDRHAAGLVREARRLDPRLVFEGLGGPCLAAEGVMIHHPAGEIGVVGISEVIGHLPAIWRALTDMKRRLKATRPDLLLLVDLPDFNLNLAKTALAERIPVVYFISPQVWAWRPERVHLIRQRVRHMLVLFPFEETFYREHGVPVTFVGHPLAEAASPRTPAPEARRALGLDPAAPTFGLLPGSRAGEIRRHLAPLLDVARCVRAAMPQAQFALPIAATVSAATIDEPLRAAGLPIAARQGEFDLVLDACDAAAVASGTATLEVALRGVPQVVVYRISGLTAMIWRRKLTVPFVSLVNLIAGREIVPELLQEHFQPQRVADLLVQLARAGPERERMLADLAGLRASLGTAGAYRRAAEVLLGVLDEVSVGQTESPPEAQR